jgi:hypothetical protein
MPHSSEHDVSNPRRTSDERWRLATVIGASAIVIGLLMTHALSVARQDPVAGHDIAHAPAQAPSTPPPSISPAAYDVTMPPSIKSLWAASRACASEGGRWREAIALNPSIPIHRNRAVIQANGQRLKVPANWRCPASWRTP